MITSRVQRWGERLASARIIPGYASVVLESIYPTKKIVLMRLTTIVLTTFLAVVLTIAGAPMLLNSATAQHNAAHLHIGPSLSRLIGVFALAGTGGLAAGLIWRPLSIVTATAVIGLMIGAIIYHRRAADPVLKFVPALVTGALALALLTVSVAQRPQS